MAWLDDLGAVLEEDGVGVINTSIFYTKNKKVPVTDGPFLHLIETSGTMPRYVQGEELPAYYFPGAQINARGKEYQPTAALARAAYNSIARVKNRLIGVTWYRRIRPTQEPGDRGLDDTGRVLISFNVLGDKGPS